ncbi:MAG TPA: hypothetical protein VKT49_13590 [Bryobacteraceae bacterium]|nr:hypothetical protein [Bryobacteraceae bacterium]
MRKACLWLTMGLALPVFAQHDLSGTWVAQYHEDQPERGPGPEIGDYLGLPINDAARFRADNWDASLLTLPEWQCRPHPSDYGDRHSHVRIWEEIDAATQQLVAYHTHREWQAQERTIYMDGRPHPPDYVAHTWQGFSTGKWEGSMLTITTTHLKTGYIRRNGVARSDRATVVEHFLRHGNYLTMVSIVTDPVYLTEPFIRSSDYLLDNTHQIPPYPCEAVVEVERPTGAVPHHLPGTNSFLSEFPEKYGLPAQAARGGAETMYPEYRLKIRKAQSAKTVATQSAAR